MVISIEFMIYVIPPVLGLIAGAFGSILAPWIHWGIDKRKEKRKKREILIENCREDVKMGNHLRYFKNNNSYQKINVYLKEEIKNKIDGNTCSVDEILSEFIRLEVEWDLI